MKLRIAEKILKRYFTSSNYWQHKVANHKEIEALKICKKFKDNEYWPMHLRKDKSIMIIIGG